MGKRYAILGGGGSSASTPRFYLLDHADPKVIGIGRNLLRPEPFSLNIEKRAALRVSRLPRDLRTRPACSSCSIDKKPEVIVNFAAQGEGAVSWKHSWRFFETNSMALARLTEELMKRDWLERFIQIGTSEMYGSVDHAATEDEPIKPTSPYAASKVAFDMYLVSVHKFLKFPMNIIRPSNAYCPGQLLHRVIPKAIVLRTARREAAAAWRRPRGEVLHSCARSRPRHSPGRREGAARQHLQCRSGGADIDPPGRRADRQGARHAVRAAVRSHRRPPRPGFALLARLLRDQARRRLGAADRLGGRPRGDGRLGAASISTTLKDWPTDYTMRA